METYALARFWAAAAWADDELHPAERAVLQRYIEAATDLTPSQRAAAETFLTARPGVSFDEVEALSRTAKEGLYQAVIRMVMVDGKVTDDELRFVTRLRDQLELDAATIARLEDEVRAAQSAKAE